MTTVPGTQLILTHYGHRYIGFRRRVLDPETLDGNPMDRLLLDCLLNMCLAYEETLQIAALMRTGLLQAVPDTLGLDEIALRYVIHSPSICERAYVPAFTRRTACSGPASRAGGPAGGAHSSVFSSGP